jgi:hypothetical protein
VLVPNYQALTERAKIILEAARAKRPQQELQSYLASLQQTVEPTMQALKQHAVANGCQNMM